MQSEGDRWTARRKPIGGRRQRSTNQRQSRDKRAENRERERETHRQRLRQRQRQSHGKQQQEAEAGARSTHRISRPDMSPSSCRWSTPCCFSSKLLRSRHYLLLTFAVILFSPPCSPPDVQVDGRRSIVLRSHFQPLLKRIASRTPAAHAGIQGSRVFDRGFFEFD